jgi:uncharacterized membrane protein YccC
LTQRFQSRGCTMSLQHKRRVGSIIGILSFYTAIGYMQQSKYISPL